MDGNMNNYGYYLDTEGDELLLVRDEANKYDYVSEEENKTDDSDNISSNNSIKCAFSVKDKDEDYDAVLAQHYEQVEILEKMKQSDANAADNDCTEINVEPDSYTDRLHRWLNSTWSSVGGEEHTWNNEIVEVDARSIYVGNVDYKATAYDLQAHFLECGYMNRITIPCNKYTGKPKGFGYIEFDTRESALAALALHGTLLHDRIITVMLKRITEPGLSTTDILPASTLTISRASDGSWNVGTFPDSQGGGSSRIKSPRRGHPHYAPY